MQTSTILEPKPLPAVATLATAADLVTGSLGAGACVVFTRDSSPSREDWLHQDLAAAAEARTQSLRVIDAASASASRTIADLHRRPPAPAAVVAVAGLECVLAAPLDDAAAAATRAALLRALLEPRPGLHWVLLLDVSALPHLRTWQALVPDLLDQTVVLPGAGPSAAPRAAPGPAPAPPQAASALSPPPWAGAGPERPAAVPTGPAARPRALWAGVAALSALLAGLLLLPPSAPVPVAAQGPAAPAAPVQDRLAAGWPLTERPDRIAPGALVRSSYDALRQLPAEARSGLQIVAALPPLPMQVWVPAATPLQWLHEVPAEAWRSVSASEGEALRLAGALATTLAAPQAGARGAAEGLRLRATLGPAALPGWRALLLKTDHPSAMAVRARFLVQEPGTLAVMPYLLARAGDPAAAEAAVAAAQALCRDLPQSRMPAFDPLADLPHPLPWLPASREVLRACLAVPGTTVASTAFPSR